MLLLAGPMLALQWLTVVRALDRAIELEGALFGQRVQNTGQLLAQAFNGQVRAYDHFLLGLRSELEEGRPPAQAAAGELALLHERTDLQFHLIDRNGRLVFSTLPNTQVGVDLSDRATYQAHRALRRDQLVVSNPIRPFDGGPLLIHFTRPRLGGQDAAFEGMISLSLPAEAFCKLFESVDFSENAVLGLTQADGNVLARCTSRRVDGQVRMGPTDMDPDRKVKVGLLTQEAERRRSPIDGLERMVTTRVLPSFPMYMYYGTPLEALEASNWELRWRYGLAGALVSVLLVVTIFGLLLALRTRENAARFMSAQVKAMATSQAELEASRAALQALSTHQVNVRDEEGRRIAQEIHDELGQRLTVVRMDLAYLARGLPPGDAIRQVGIIKDQIDDALAIARDISRKLQPAGLEVGLSTAVEILVSELAQSLTVSLTLNDELPPRLKLPEPIAVAAFRIIQEGVTNAIRHARPVHIGVSMALREGSLVLRIEDDGQGLPAEPGQGTPTFGLSGMRERALSVGGTLVIDSAPDQGVVIMASLPLSVDPTQSHTVTASS